MAKLRDSNGTIVIDSGQAAEDVANLKKAKQSLEESRQKLLREKNTLSSVCQGTAHNAFLDKADDLVRNIDNTIASIERASVAINNAVAKYQETDKRVAAALQVSASIAGNAANQAASSAGGKK